MKCYDIFLFYAKTLTVTFIREIAVVVFNVVLASNSDCNYKIELG